VAVLEQFGIRGAKMPAFSASAIVLKLFVGLKYVDRTFWA